MHLSINFPQCQKLRPAHLPAHPQIDTQLLVCTLPVVIVKFKYLLEATTNFHYFVVFRALKAYFYYMLHAACSRAGQSKHVP